MIEYNIRNLNLSDLSILDIDSLRSLEYVLFIGFVTSSTLSYEHCNQIQHTLFQK